MNKTRLGKYIPLITLSAIFLLLPVVTKHPYYLHILIMTGLTIMLAASLRLSVLANLFNLGHIAFYAIGAYTSMLLVTKWSMSFWLSMPIAGIVAGIVALCLGCVTTRVKELYFCMLTLVFVELVKLGIVMMPIVGAFTVAKIPPPDPITIPHLFTLEFISAVPYYYLLLVLLGITLGILYMIEKSPMAQTLKSMTESEPLTQSIGVNIARYRVMSFSIASFFAGIAGAFFAAFSTVIGPGSFTVMQSLMLYIIVVVGGQSSLWGPVVGGAFLTILPEALRNVAAYTYQPTFYAIALILIVYLVPEGLIDLPRTIRVNIHKLTKRGTVHK